jgi:hypothetical protein
MTTASLSGDFDGDGKADIAFWVPGTGTWNITYSSDGSQHSQQWGQDGDVPVPADYDGDGKADLAVWRPGTGTWWIIHSSDGSQHSQQWGQAGDIPVPGDYDGDGKADLAVWRPGTGTWWIIHSSDGSQHTQQSGQPGDVPVPGSAAAIATASAAAPAGATGAPAGGTTSGGTLSAEAGQALAISQAMAAVAKGMLPVIAELQGAAGAAPGGPDAVSSALAPTTGQLQSQAADLLSQGNQLTSLLQSIDAAVAGSSSASQDPPAS